MLKRWFDYLLTRLGLRKTRQARMINQIMRANCRPTIQLGRNAAKQHIILQGNRRMLVEQIILNPE